MITEQRNSLRQRIAHIWPRWRGLSLSWIIIVSTVWLLPGDLLHKWFGGPQMHATLDFISWLVLPPASALLVLLVLSPANPVGRAGSQVRPGSVVQYPVPMGRFQKFVITALALSTFATLMLAFGFGPGPKLKTLMWSLYEGNLSSSGHDTEKSADQKSGVKLTPNVDVFFEEVRQEDQKAEKARLEEELRDLRAGQTVNDDLRRLRSAIELEKARLECEIQPSNCDIEAPDEQN